MLTKMQPQLHFNMKLAFWYLRLSMSITKYTLTKGLITSNFRQIDSLTVFTLEFSTGAWILFIVTLSIQTATLILIKR